MERFSLASEVAFVTGAGLGIGRAIAIGLARAGAVVGCFDLVYERAAEVAESISISGGEALALSGDVSSEDDVRRALGKLTSHSGHVSIGVNNAGVGRVETSSETTSVDTWRQVLDVNLTGVFVCAKLEALAMIERKKGVILNTSSMSAHIVNRGIVQPHYNASKAAVSHLTKSLAAEWARHGVRVNAISPGYTVTAFIEENDSPEERAKWALDVPLGRLATVDDLVGPAIFLVSDAARYCTGVDLLVDGGFTCW